MTKGTVLFHPRFHFTDGTLGKKYLIILNNPDLKKSEPFLFCRTTSNPNRKPEAHGCYSEKNLFVLDAIFDFFPLKTWVQFYEIFEASSEELLRDKFKLGLDIVGQLKQQTINTIVNCIKRSDDISRYHLFLLH